MPSIMIHEKVGYELSKIIKINSYDYYLGLMAPDAPNLEGFAKKEERWMAHQRRDDYDEWRDSLDFFYQKEKNHYSSAFLTGYYIHILTDIVYDDFLYLKVRENILKDYSMDEAHRIMSEDMNKYYFPEIEDIKKVLISNNISFDILNITSKQLLLWKDKQVNSFRDNNACKYINDDIIESLINQVLKEYLARIGH